MRRILYTFLLLLIAGPTLADPIIRLGASQTYLRIGKYTSWYVDSSAALSFDDVRSRTFHRSSYDIGAFGLTDAAVWAHGRFSHNGRDTVYLLVEFANVDSITLYYYHTGRLHTVSSGSRGLLHEKSMNIPGFCFEIPVTNDQPVDFWLRIRSGNKVIIPLALATAEGLPYAMIGLYFAEVLYMGIVLALLLYNLFLYLWIRDRDYLYYLGYLTSLAAFILLYLRGFHVFLGQQASWFVNIYGISFVAISYIFAILFTVSFLRGKQYAPKMTKVLHVIAALLVIPLIFNLAGDRWTAIRLQEIISIVVPAMFVWMGIIAYRKGYRPALYFLVAWLLLLLTIMLFSITNSGLLPWGNWTFLILPFGSAMEVILLSLALGYRYALLKKETIELQEKNLLLEREQNQQLEQRVNERTGELNRTMVQLKSSNQVKDKLLGIISHDLRTPLSSLSGLLQLIEMKALSPTELQEFSQTVRQHIKQTTGQMQNMLNWALAQMNRMETRPVAIAMKPFITEIADAYIFTAQQKDIRLLKTVQEDLYVWCDYHQLEVVLRNLLDNAIKFTLPGGVITLGCQEVEDGLEISVADGGTGMEQAVADALLREDIVQSSEGTANERGTGLGLSLCKEFISNNGGTLKVKSAPGSGTRFYFTLSKSKSGPPVSGMQDKKKAG